MVRDCLGMKFEGDAVRGGWGSRHSKQLLVGSLYKENKHKKHCDRLNWAEMVGCPASILSWSPLLGLSLSLSCFTKL